MTPLDLAKRIVRRTAKKADLAAQATAVFGETTFLDEITHYIYGGDTLLHVAAAAYDLEAIATLLAAGAAGVKADAKARRLASSTTGRGGSGSPEAKKAQAAIEKLLR